MKRPLYFDNNATTPIDPLVREEMLLALEEHFGNPASSTHRYGWAAEELVAVARERVASLLGAKPEEFVFTSGATESNNLAIFGIASGRRDSSKNKIISSRIEHRAVLEPLEILKSRGNDVILLDPDQQGVIPKERLLSELDQSTLLVSLMHGNNEIGSINSIEHLASLAADKGAFFHTDATQTIGKLAINLSDSAINLLSLSAHKINGPKGVGALYISKSLPKDALQPLFFGGGHEKGLRGGTLNVPGIVGLGKACQLAEERLATIAKKLTSLSERMLEAIEGKVSGVTLQGPRRNRLPGNLNITFEGIDSAALIGELEPNIAVSSSSACSSSLKKGSHVLRAIGLDEEAERSSIRIGIGVESSEEDVDFAVLTIVNAVDKLRTF